MTIFLTRNIILCRPWLHYYWFAIEWRSHGSIAVSTESSERLSDSSPASTRPAATFFGVIEPWRDNGDIRPAACRKYHHCRRISLVISPTRPCRRYILARPLLSSTILSRLHPVSPFLSASTFCVSSCSTCGSRVAGEICRPPELFLRETWGTLFYRQSRLRRWFLLRLYFHPSLFSE